MAMNNFWNRIFGKEENNSKTVAKERLRLVLMHDRLDVSDQMMNELREELIAVIGKYMVIDEPQLEVSLTHEEEGVALVANIPIVNVRRQYTKDSFREDPPEAEATEQTPADEARVTEDQPAAKKAAGNGPIKPETNVEAYIEA